MSDYLISLIRTAVPAGVAALLAYLGSTWGIVLDQDSSVAVTAGAVALVCAVYYGLVRALQNRWPSLGWLLGAKKVPVYTEATRRR